MQRSASKNKQQKSGKVPEYNHATEDEKKEYFDEPEVLESKIDQLVDLIKRSKRIVAFTGAGLSTAAGISDYRSGANTAVEVGAGAWEKKAIINKAIE